MSYLENQLTWMLILKMSEPIGCRAVLEFPWTCLTPIENSKNPLWLQQSLTVMKKFQSRLSSHRLKSRASRLERRTHFCKSALRGTSAWLIFRGDPRGYSRRLHQRLHRCKTKRRLATLMIDDFFPYFCYQDPRATCHNRATVTYERHLLKSPRFSRS